MTVVTSRGFFASQAIAAKHSIGCTKQPWCTEYTRVS